MARIKFTTATTKRTDIHRPSAEEFDPAGYECVGCFDLRPEMGDIASVAARMFCVNLQIEAGYKFSGAHGMGSCDHCGASIRYAALMIHPSTHGMIWVGEQCLGNRFGLSKGEFQTLRKNASLNRDRMKKEARIAQIIEAMSEEVVSAYFWALSLDDSRGFQMIGEGPAAYSVPKNWDDCTEAEKAARSDKGWNIASDIASKVRQYKAPLSGKQEAFLVKLCREHTEKRAAAEEARRAIEAGERKGVPTGRVSVKGVILTTKSEENDYGVTLKMLVLSDDGFKLWGTVPSSILYKNPRKGSRVEFSAKVEPSTSDPLFGTFSRPTKAMIEEDEEEEAEAA